MLTSQRSTLMFIGLLSASAALRAQLPATPATNVTAPISATSAGQQRDSPARHRAQVTYINGLLDVRADNSSLNGILRDISQATGMKLTGSVSDQRVFGNYGPAEPSTVLATLLDGTGTNMLLRETADNGPRELVLTARTGGPTPPSPSVQNSGDEDAEENPAQSQQEDGNDQPRTQLPPGQMPGERAFGPRSIAQPLNNVLGSPANTTQTPSTMPTYQSVPTDAISTPSVAQDPPSGIVDSTNPPPAGSTTMGSSTPTNTNNLGDGTATTPANGPKTPDQIFQQLQQLRQQSQQQPDANSNNGNTPQ